MGAGVTSVDDLKRALSEVLDERDRVDAKTHRLHHDWIGEQLECDRRRRQMFLAVAQRVAGWAIIGVLGWIGWAVWHELMRAIGR